MPTLPASHAERMRKSRTGKAVSRQYDRERAGDPHHRFTSCRRWRKFRKWFLARHPVCDCGQAASVVHHIVDRRERSDLAFSEENCRALCPSCHSSETTRRENVKRAPGRPHKGR